MATELHPVSPRASPAHRNPRHAFVSFLVSVLCTLAPLRAQTVEWNLSLPATAPSPRLNHAMAYDAARGVIVLFGGTSPGANGETWEWNGTAWSQRSVSGPSPRVQHAMAYDAARGVTVLFGGNLGGGIISGETWEWNGTAWSQRSVTGPSPRYGHAMAYDAARGVTVLFGGFAGSNSGQTL
jgi:hypothetical protein